MIIRTIDRLKHTFPTFMFDLPFNGNYPKPMHSNCDTIIPKREWALKFQINRSIHSWG